MHKPCMPQYFSMDSSKLHGFYRVASLLVGCVATGLAFSSDAFSISAQTFKEVFNYSQTEVEMIMSMAMLGLVSAWPASLLLQLWGPKWLSLLALFGTSGGCSLVCMAIYFHANFYGRAYLVAGFFLVIGIGNGMMYITATSVNLVNFEGRWLGLVSGVLHSVKSVVLGILLVAFECMSRHQLVVTMSSRVAPDSPAGTLEPVLEAAVQENPGGVWTGGVAVLMDYMALLCCMYAGTNMLAILFYGDYRIKSDSNIETDKAPLHHQGAERSSSSDTGEESEDKPILMTSSKKYESCTNTPVDEHKQTGSHPDHNQMASPSRKAGEDKPDKGQDTGSGGWTCRLLREPYFHALFWPCVCIMGFRNSFLNNLSILMSAMHLLENRVIFILVPLIGAISKPIIGVLADISDHKIPRPVLILACCIVMELFCLLDIGLIYSLHALIGTMMMAQITSSCIQTLGPPILIMLFGSESFAVGWGLITVGFTLGTVFLQLILGIFYDLMAPGGHTMCYGVPCFLVFFWINAVLIYFTCVALWFLSAKIWKSMKSTVTADTTCFD